MERVAAKLGHDSFTWRTVPTNNRSLGKSAVAVEPIVEQWFLSSRGIKQALDTEQQVRGCAAALSWMVVAVL
jgi:glutamate synthase (NADPH/NADH)